MAGVKDCLNELIAIDGALGACLVAVLILSSLVREIRKSSRPRWKQ